MTALTTNLPDNDLRDLYQDLILDHSKRPHNFRVVDPATHDALGHNPLCGDRLSLTLRVDDKGIVSDVGFQGSGCAISVASASIMTDMLKGKTVDEAKALFSHMHAACTGTVDANASSLTITEDDEDRLQALAGVRQYPMRVKCATLAWHTMNSALSNSNKASTE
jgi:nitrogen fixation NifU-like protein